MSTRLAILLTAAILLLPTLLSAAEPSPLVTGALPGSALVGGSGRLFILTPDGKIAWEHKAALVHDAWMLPTGNILYADGQSVTEITPDHKVVFQFKPELQQGGGAYACQRLPNGNTLIGENSTGRVLEVDKAGKILFQLQTTPATKGAHQNLRMVRKLENGNYLVCHSGSNLVKEYTPDGQVVFEIKTPNLAFAAIRTPANTTLVSTLDHIYEYDASGKVVWQFANTDLPGIVITNMTGMHLLSNGNLAVGCYSAYKDGAGAGLFEITRDRRLIWRYTNPHADSSMMAVQRLSDDSKLLPGNCIR